eukprot:7141574-Prymnesium_polylepis.1
MTDSSISSSDTKPSAAEKRNTSLSTLTVRQPPLPRFLPPAMLVAVPVASPWTSTIFYQFTSGWPMADVVAKGGIGRLR